MGGGSPTYNYPEQPSYGEGMADALKAQVELLTGKGDFAEIAPDGLEGLLPLEESIRKKTAQTDTDVLRQTLLGDRQEATTGTYDSEGRFVVGQESTDGVKEVKKPYTFVTESTEPGEYSGNGQNVKVTVYHDGKYVREHKFFSAKGSSRKAIMDEFKRKNSWDDASTYDKYYKDGKTVKETVAGGGGPKTYLR